MLGYYQSHMSDVLNFKSLTLCDLEHAEWVVLLSFVFGSKTLIG